MKNDKTANIFQRLAYAMSLVKGVNKAPKANGMQYRAMAHDDVTQACREPLLSAGIIYHPSRCVHSQSGNRTEVSMTLRFVNIHNPTDVLETETFGYGVDQQDKGPGKAMSYAVKYGLLKTLGLETGDDCEKDNFDFNSADPALPIVSTETQIADAKIALEGCQTVNQLADLWKKIPKEVKAPLSEIKDALKADFIAPQTPPDQGIGFIKFNDAAQQGQMQ